MIYVFIHIFMYVHLVLHCICIYVVMFVVKFICIYVVMFVVKFICIYVVMFIVKFICIYGGKFRHISAYISSHRSQSTLTCTSDNLHFTRQVLSVGLHSLSVACICWGVCNHVIRYLMHSV